MRNSAFSEEKYGSILDGLAEIGKRMGLFQCAGQ